MKIKSIILIASFSGSLLFANETQSPTEQRSQIEKSIVEASRSIVPQKRKVEALETDLKKETLTLKKLEDDLESKMSELKALHQTKKADPVVVRQ